ncbi:hypothetical protein L3Q82_000620 [Scortum barcoo]|uniref:Uncharacterized protein n=1 Tax=Scortum barcoo TaxID=214431 RepID=A0ACB8WF63_9TELE|nr:hypothetical protein L3Q82_000620 [Scortum barcoo]
MSPITVDVICKLYDGVGSIHRPAVMGEEGVEEQAQHTALWCTSVECEYDRNRSQFSAADRKEDCSLIMKVSISLPKYSAIFFCLAVFVLIFALRNMDFVQDALEERLLLDSITWPDTPVLPSPFSLEQTSDPAHSTFTILSGRRGGQWHVGDQLEALIKMYDFQGRPKKSGGDVLLARLHNPTLGAGVAGQVVDHLNGSYSAVFSLLWEGSAEVEQPLCNYTDLHTGEPWFCYKPDNLSCDARIIHRAGGYTQKLKDKEEKLFQSGVNMKVSIRASGPASVTVLPKKEGVAGWPTKITPRAQLGDDSSKRSQKTPQQHPKNCRPHLPQLRSTRAEEQQCTVWTIWLLLPGCAWQSLGGSTVRQFKTSSDISQCLKGKVIHMYGDSTVRQWFDYLKAALPDLKQFDLHSERQSGPFMTLDYANNILVTFRCHGPPIRIENTYISQLRYIANEIDGIKGSTNTVVIFGIWAHFGNFPFEVYIRRLQSIRRAVVRLLDRAPGTLVVIRTGNPKALILSSALNNSD